MAQKINFLGTGNSSPKLGYKELNDALKAKLNGMTTAQVVEQGLLTISNENPVKEISLKWIDKVTGQDIVSKPFFAILFDQGFVRLSKGLDLATLNDYYTKGIFGDLVFRLSEQPNKRGVLTKYFSLDKSNSKPKSQETEPIVYKVETLENFILEEEFNEEIEQHKHLPEKEIEIIEDTIHNESVRVASERLVNTLLAKKYGNKLIWSNEFGESGESFDFKVINAENTLYIECKGTASTTTKEFYLTKKEWNFLLNNRNNYQLFFISNALSSNPSIIQFNNFLQAILDQRVVPFFATNKAIKSERIPFTIL